MQSKSIALYSPEYYYTCALGGILACGTTHALVTPLDLVKCRKQYVLPELSCSGLQADFTCYLIGSTRISTRETLMDGPRS